MPTTFTGGKPTCRVGDDGNLADIEELLKVGWQDGEVISASRGKLTGEEAVSMNFWIFSAAVMPVLQDCFADFLDAHINEPKSEFFIPLAMKRMIDERGQTLPDSLMIIDEQDAH